MNNLLSFLMSEADEKMTPLQKEQFNLFKKIQHSVALRYESEAIQVIKAKIDHYEKTGKSPFKLQVYKDKLKHHKSIQEQIKSLLPS